MTPQEQAMLNDLIGRVEQTQLTEKDPDAEQLLAQRLGGHPDALYVLAQTVLVQKYALEQAQAQINQLRQQSQQQQPARTGSFLGNLLGHREPAPPPPPPPMAPSPGYGAAPAPPYGQPYPQPWTPVPSYGAPPPSMGGGSSFLRSAATTAAGVAAGALAFEGVESLMHGFGHSSGFGGGEFLGGGMQGMPQETVINNYYDDAGRQGGDLDNSRNDAADLQQASDDLQTQDDSSLDDVSYDDSSSGNDDIA